MTVRYQSLRKRQSRDVWTPAWVLPLPQVVCIALHSLLPVSYTHLTTLQTIQLVGELSHALAIIHFNDFDEPKIKSEISKYHLQIHELFLDELCFVAYPQHPLFHCQPLCLEQIFAYPFLMDSDCLVYTSRCV